MVDIIMEIIYVFIEGRCKSPASQSSFLLGEKPLPKVKATKRRSTLSMPFLPSPGTMVLHAPHKLSSLASSFFSINDLNDF
jgi:hypothetical protein